MDAGLTAQRTTSHRILLVADDPTEGGMLAEQLISKGSEVFWARDTSEARWLWMPNVYDVVLIALRKDVSGANGLVGRIKAECPMQAVSLADESELLKKRSPTSVRSKTALKGIDRFRSKQS